MTFTARIQDRGNGPAIHINGKPIHLGGIGRACQRQDTPSLLGAEVSSLCLLWPRPFFEIGEQPDLDGLVRQYEQLLAAKPDALLSTVITLAPSARWAQDHPEEMTAYSPAVDGVVPANPSRSPEPSWASAVWRETAAEFLRSTVKHLHDALGGRIVLYQFGAGKCGENFPVPDPVRYNQWYCADFSEPMQRWFSDWLRRRYADHDALRKAWGDDGVDFNTAKVPPRESQLISDWFSFRSPTRSQVTDYYRAWSDAIETCVLEWAGAIKEATARQSLTSSAIGGVLDCGLNADNLQHVKRHGVKRCLASPDLDMLESPASYVLRDLGHGDTSAMIPIGSLGLHGKMWFRDLDSRTSRCISDQPQDPARVLWTPPGDAWEDEQLLKRDAGYSIVKGGSWWWHEIVPAMYSEPHHRALVEQIDRIAQGALSLDRRVPPGLAVLVDPGSDYALSNSNRLIYAMNYEARRRHWTRSGMASEVYLIDDVDHADMPAHRVIMVTNAFAISDKQAAAVQRRADATGATVIWLVAPGLITDDKFDLERVSEIVGIPIKALEVETQPTIRMIAGDHPWSKVPLPSGGQLDTFGVGPRGKDDSGAYAFGPQFYADVETAGDIAVLGLNETIARPGLVVRQHNGRRTVYCSAPYLHHALLHQIGRDSGAHVYATPGHVLHVSRGMLLLNAARREQITLRLPAPATRLYDLFTSEEFALPPDGLTLPVERHETRLFTCPLEP